MFFISLAVHLTATSLCEDCTPAIAHYVSLDALNKMIVNAGVVGGIGTAGSYLMFRREREARQAAELGRAEDKEKYEAVIREKDSEIAELRAKDKEKYEAIIREKDSEIAELRAELKQRSNGSSSNDGDGEPSAHP